MTTTQYIGARYVPLFSEPLEWDIKKEYEPLTIVYHAGNSYTSRQAVPADIDITNEEYWALTGNYNAQIEQYRKEVAQYDARITANTNKGEQLETELQAETASREADKLELTNSINALNTTLTGNINQLNTDLTDEINKITQGDTSLMVNVKDLGAVGDGKTDDTEAFHKAIGRENNPSKYSVVIVPAGDYLITEWIDMHSNLMIIGPGHIINGCDKGPVLIWSSSRHTSDNSQYLHNLIVDGLEITSRTVSGTAINNDAISIETTDYSVYRVLDFTIRNCYMHGIGGRAINMGGGKGAGGGTSYPGPTGTIAFNKIDSCGDIGICLSGAKNLTIIGNRIATTKLENLTVDNGCKDIRVIGNFFTNASGGAGTVSCDECDGAIFLGNTINGYGRTSGSVLTFNCQSGVVENVVVVGNEIGGGEHGLGMGGKYPARNMMIGSNTLRGSSKQGLWCSTTAGNDFAWGGGLIPNQPGDDSQWIINQGYLHKDPFLELLYQSK